MTSDRRARVLRGNLAAVLVTLAAPSAVSMMLSVAGAVVSALWLGRLVGPLGLGVMAAMAAVELCVGAVFQGIANGTMSVLAREIGAGSPRAGRVVLSSLLLTAVVGGALCVAGVALSGPLASLLTHEPELQPLVRAYAIGFALATPFLGIATVAIAIFAAAGWAQVALWRGLAELALLVILTPLLVERLGVIGAPLAGLAASAAVVAGIGWTLARRWDELRLGPRPASYLVADRRLWRSIGAIGAPPQIGRITSFVALGFMVSLVLRESGAAAGAIGLAYRLLIVATTFGFGFSRAQAIVAGQSIGAGLPRRAAASLWLALALGLGVGLALALLAPLARPLVELFSSDAPVVDATLRAIDAWRWLVLPITAWYVFLAACSATGRVGLASAVTVLADAAAVALVLGLGAPFGAAALWGVAAQHVIRAVLLAALMRRAFLARLPPAAGPN